MYLPVKENQRKYKQLGLHQTKKVLHSKGNHQQNKKTTHSWENIFTDTFDKGLISKVYKVLTKLNIKNTTQLKKWAKGVSIDTSPNRLPADI